jgi:predicted Zn-dependent peptidase
MSDATRQVATQMISDHLFDELRAKEGITYGARAYQRSLVGGTGVMYMNGLIQNSGVALAVQTFQKVAEDGANGAFPMNRFGATRLSRARNFGLRQQAITDLASWLSVVPALGLEWDYRWNYADRLAAVNVEDMTALMKPCPTSEVITLEGPLEVISKVLDEAGIAYEEFDFEERVLQIYDEHDKKSARKYRKYLAEKAEEEAKKAAEEAEGSEGAEE